MTPRKKKEAEEGEAPDAIDAGKAASGENTATGQAALARSGEREIPQGEDRGNKTPIVGEPAADFLNKGTNSEAQSTPAEFTVNGSVPARMVASNSGLVPISAVTKDPEQAEKLLEENQKRKNESQRAAFGKRKRLTDADILKHGRAELQAVATDRGYDISDMAGTRATRENFRRAQAEDELVEDAKE